MKMMHLLFKDRSLGYKFLVLPGIPVIVVVMFISANILTSQKETLIEKAKTRASLLTELSILTVSNEFVIYNKNLLDNIVDNLSSDTSVVYAIIVDSSDNRILAHSDHGWDGKILDHGATSSLKKSNEKPGGYEISGDINISGNKYGALKVGFSLESVHQEITQMKQQFLFVVFIAIMLGGFFSIILTRLISAPIKALVEQTKIIGTGNLENKIVYKSKDILGQLANEFNKMVSDLKAKQQQIIDSEVRLRHLVENMPVMMHALEEDSNVVAWNRECERVTGYSASEFIGNPHSIKMLYPHDDYREQMIAELLAFGLDFREKEYTLTCKDGTEKIISWSNISGRFPIPGWHTWATGVDVTERKLAENSLRETVEKYRRLIQNALVGIYQVSKDGRFITVNQKMAEMFDYESQDKFLVEVENIAHLYAHPEERPIILQEIDEKGFVADKEVEFKTKAGKPIWIKLYTTVFRDNKNTIYEGLMQDITEQKRLETQLQQARKMESIGTMAGGIAHDFNNILYMITANAELALADIPEWSPLHVYLKDIKSAGLRAAGIVKQLLSFSRKTEQKMRPIGAIPVIKDALKFLRSTIPTSIEIRKHIPDTELTILGDPTQINQVMMNLCINASQVMEETGGILEITVEEETLEEDSVLNNQDLTPGEYFKITISDTGPGIDPEIIDRIFDPYFTTKAIGKGSGMGLAVVHGIVRNHNGAIAVDSQLGKGSTFTILFPVVGEKPVMEVKTPDEIPHGNETILFVDDEESIAGMTGKMLERLGYEVETKTNPVQAVELFQLNPDRFDLIISDMTMPQMSGVKLSEKLKELRSDIPVIICTGHSPLIDEKKAKSIGIAGFVMKPLETRDIAKAIREVLDNNKSSVQS